MLTLALESSAKAASAAIFEEQKMLAFSLQNAGLTHSRTLLPMAEDLLRNLEKKPADLDQVAVSRGPGSFTGLRIGLAEAKGLCWALEIPAVGVSTLEAMAYGGMTGREQMLCCVMDARRGQVYNALFEVQGEKPVRLTEDRAISVADLQKELIRIAKPWVLLGDGAELCWQALDRKQVPVVMAPEPLRLQNARGVGLAARGSEPVSAEELMPVYLRLSQAERERLSRMRENQVECAQEEESRNPLPL